MNLSTEYQVLVHRWREAKNNGLDPPMPYKQKCVCCGRYYQPRHGWSKKCPECREIRE